MEWTLADAALFRGVDVGAVSAFGGTMRPVEYPAGHVFYIQGVPGERLFIIISGKVKLCRRAPDGQESLFAVLGPSDMFGELSVFDSGPRTSSAIAIVDVRAVHLDRNPLRAWIIDHPVIAERLLWVMSRRLRRTDIDVSDLVFADVTGRVAKQLLRLAQQFGTRVDGATRVNHDLTQEELGQLVGSSREAVNKALAEFCHRRWIRMEGKTIVITDSERLANRARSLPPQSEPGLDSATA